ncbi:MAG: hypothetical protein ACREHD_31925, partial [Pirellulales bacterium]
MTIYPYSFTLPAGFTLYAAPPSSLAPGATGNFTIQFTAAQVGSFSGTVSFNSSDRIDNPYTFQISAAAVPPWPTNVSVSSFGLVDDTDGTDAAPLTYDPIVSGVVDGTFSGGYVVVQFDDSGSGTPQASTAEITATGTSFTYDPRTGDPALANYSGPVDLRYRIASFNSAGTEIDGPWSDFDFTLIAQPVGAHVDHMALVNDTDSTQSGIPLTYDPRVTAVVNGPFLGVSADVDFTIVPGSGNISLGPATGEVDGILYAGQTFTFNPLTADPSLAGYSGPLTLQYYAVDLDASGNVVHTGNPLTFTVTLYVPTPNVSVSGFGLFDDTDPGAATLSTADPRVTGTVSRVPAGETVEVQFSHHGDGTINGSVAITSSNLTFSYDPRVSEPALAN